MGRVTHAPPDETLQLVGETSQCAASWLHPGRNGLPDTSLQPQGECSVRYKTYREGTTFHVDRPGPRRHVGSLLAAEAREPDEQCGRVSGKSRDRWIVGCAVTTAIADGRIEADRIASYRKLKAEAAYLDRRSDHVARTAAVARHKTALRTLKYHQEYRHDDGW